MVIALELASLPTRPECSICCRLPPPPHGCQASQGCSLGGKLWNLAKKSLQDMWRQLMMMREAHYNIITARLPYSPHYQPPIWPLPSVKGCECSLPTFIYKPVSYASCLTRSPEAHISSLKLEVSPGSWGTILCRRMCVLNLLYHIIQETLRLSSSALLTTLLIVPRSSWGNHQPPMGSQGFNNQEINSMEMRRITWR